MFTKLVAVPLFETKALLVQRQDIRLFPDPERVILHFFNQGEDRAQRLIGRILAQPEAEIVRLWHEARQKYALRHADYERVLLSNYARIEQLIPSGRVISPEARLLIGSYFTQEYSLEAAALFNPSIVPHPDQNTNLTGERSFVMSLRSVGEGHLSSIQFRTGKIDREGNVQLDLQSMYTYTPEVISDANSYRAVFDPIAPLSGRVLFPQTASEARGMEDARFVMFRDDNGRVVYYAPYTAYDGRDITPQLIETTDFTKFTVSELTGSASKNKGMALFPEKINGKYAMISRNDGENIYIMFSDDLYTWEKAAKIVEPKYAWELMQLGNCGSPVRTDKGWLLLTHGVGNMREYALGAVLLDLGDPTKVIGRLREPLISPNEQERSGYVPNVVYTCGLLEHNGILYIPYAASDNYTSFATVRLEQLLELLLSNPS